jgi:hypothetical protein
VAGSCEFDNEYSGSIKDGALTEQLSLMLASEEVPFNIELVTYRCLVVHVDGVGIGL